MPVKRIRSYFALIILIGWSCISLPSQNNSWPTPNSYIEGIPLYETFDQIEGIFHQNNDTSYVINFWATWCKPCVKELPYFEEFNKAYQNKKVKVILVSLDFPRQIEKKLIPFIKKEQLQSTILVLLDGKFNRWIDKVSPEWTGTIPATYAYNSTNSYFMESTVESLQEIEEILNSL